MRVYKCDRCGKMVEKTNLFNLRKPRVFYLGTKATICDDCKRSFYRWFSEVRENA